MVQTTISGVHGSSNLNNSIVMKNAKIDYYNMISISAPYNDLRAQGAN